MARTFETLREAALEIRRDLAKGTKVDFTRVQQHVDQNLPGRERQGYEYAIMEGGMPNEPITLCSLGKDLGFKPYVENFTEMLGWLPIELADRLYPLQRQGGPPTELQNPLLKSTVEGNYPSYTYRERLMGATSALVEQLYATPDTRRAFWPIFQPQDSWRAISPTRVPCSIGYEVMLRNVDGAPRVQMFYLSRSCDFDRFWLSDIWFAYKFGCFVASELGYQMGSVHHYIISLHSFDVDMHEIY